MQQRPSFHTLKLVDAGEWQSLVTKFPPSSNSYIQHYISLPFAGFITAMHYGVKYGISNYLMMFLMMIM